jgi:hypothetical protein
MSPTNVIPRYPYQDAFVGCPGTEWGDPRWNAALGGEMPLCISGNAVADSGSIVSAPVVGSMYKCFASKY